MFEFLNIQKVARKVPCFVFGMLAITTYSHAATSLGKTSADKFETVYVDRINGLRWTRALPGTYTNGCVHDNRYGRFEASKCTISISADGSRQVKVEDSAAAKACQDIGARLPTKDELKSLIRNFYHTTEIDGPRLTRFGKEDMQAVFGDMPNWFWSSSVDLDNKVGAEYFDGDYGYVLTLIRDADFAVRCVTPR